MRYSFFTALLVLAIFAGTSMAQNVFVPLNVRKAYERQTRSYDGTPGSNYWQNHAQYTIRVKVLPKTRTLQGHETIVYFNESPDTLHQLVLRLYQDLYKKGNLRDWPISTADLTDGVSIDFLRIDRDTLRMETSEKGLRRYGTNVFLYPKHPIPPKGQVTLELKWQLLLPHKSNIRMGTYDSTSFFVGLWYPQMAVYDDIDGWDRLDYSGIQEFYNDFSDYDVRITVPQNFVVWATGLLQNPKEVLQPEILKRFRQAQRTSEVVHIVTPEDSARVTRAARDWNTWHFKALHVPDFSFATSDHYLWDAATIEVGKDPAHSVFISAAFKKEAENFRHAVEIARKSIVYYSDEMPAVPYPYPAMTVFNGAGGMEYPMMVNEGSPKAWSGMVHVTSHEIAHTYFPFMMGVNERKYAWMDEGWATMLPFDLQHRLAPEYDPIARTVQRYLRVAGSEYDVPMRVLTSAYGADTRDSYRNEAYNRPGIAYFLLEQMVGKKAFVKMMQEYIRRWQGKHPLPYDFFFTANNLLKEDLSWFWNTWFSGFGYPDLKLEKAQMKDGKLLLKVVKKGLLPVPIKLTIVYSDSSSDVLERSMRVWSKGQNAIELVTEPKKSVLEVKLGDAHIPDADDHDNLIRF